MQKKAIILFSGGLDSTTCLAYAIANGYLPYTLSFDYGQKHRYELIAATEIAKFFNVKEHKIIKLEPIMGSALTETSMTIPDYKGDSKVPVTYVPARNTLFLSMALGWAELIEAYDLFIGANIIDYSGYPDCRPAFLHAFENVANLGTKAGVEGKRFTIHAPLLKLNKAEIIRLGQSLGIDYSMTVTCYRSDMNGHACGTCDSCTYRKKGFLEADLEDPTVYYA